MSSNELGHEADHVQYVDEQEMHVVVGPSRSDNWNFRKEKSKSKLSRRKAMLTRHINVAENLLKSRGSRRKLRELAAKIEEALKELEQASEEYESFLELEGLREHLTLTENAVERANLCLESIDISINEREKANCLQRLVVNVRPCSDLSQPAVMVHPRAPVKVRGVHV